MSSQKRPVGRPRLPEPEVPLAPLKARTPASELDAAELEARRYADRIKMRRYREARRRNRANPQGFAIGEDGLKRLQAEAAAAGLVVVTRDTYAELNAAYHQQQAILRHNGAAK